MSLIKKDHVQTDKLVSFIGDFTIEEKAVSYLEKGADAVADQLTEKDKEQIQRIIQANRLFMQYGTRKKVASMMMNYYKEIGKSYSYSTCYNDTVLAERVFGKFLKYDKDFMRHLHSEKIRELAIKLEHIDKDYKGATKAWAESAKVLRLDEEEIDGPDPEKMQPPNVIFINNPQLIMENPDPDLERKVRKEVKEFYNLDADEVKFFEEE